MTASPDAPAPAWTTRSLPAPALDAVADLATVQVLVAELRHRLGAAGEELLDRFDRLHREDRALSHAGRDLEHRQADIARRQVEIANRQEALEVLERLVSERRNRLMTEIVVIETMRAAVTR